MHIFTSYYANIKNIKEDLCFVSISLQTPKGVKIQNYKPLMPTWFILNEYKQDMDEEKYIKRYNKLILENIDIKKMLIDLESISNGKDVCLLCYEKPSDFCHRHLISDFLILNGINCKEI